MVAQPDRLRQGVEHAAHGQRLVRHQYVLVLQVHQLQPVARYIADSQHGAPHHGTSVGLHHAPADGAQRHAEAFAMVFQAVDGSIDRLRLGRGQPASEREDAAVCVAVRQESQIALDLRLTTRSAPGHDDLRIGGEQDVRPVASRAQAGILGEDLRLALDPAPALADVNDRGRGREDDEAHEDGKADRAVGIDPRGNLRDHVGPGRRGCGQGEKDGGDKSRRGGQRAPQHPRGAWDKVHPGSGTRFAERVGPRAPSFAVPLIGHAHCFPCL